MLKRMFFGVVALALVATACTGSAEVAVVDPQVEVTSAPERETVDQVEPTAEPQVPTPLAAPTPPVAVSPEPAATPDIPVTSPEAPLPATWLCTANVDEDEELNLRSEPSLDAPIVFGIPGESCRMRVELAAADGWVGVRYITQNSSMFGYVSTDFSTEDAIATLAYTWFERVVAEQDVSDIAEQELVDEWIAFHAFPPSAFELRPFDDGNPRPCRPVGPNRSGCPIHVVDSDGELVTPMVIETQEIAVNGERELRVVGFNLCFGTEDCLDVDFPFHDRIVVDRREVGLAGQSVGDDAEPAIDALILAFGEPDEDTGWVVGCPLDSEELRNERYLSWGSLTAGFRNDEDQEYFNYWSYEVDPERAALPFAPQPSEVRLPFGISMGMNLSEAGAILLEEPFENELLQVRQINTGTYSLYGPDLATDTRITAVAVPVIPICD